MSQAGGQDEDPLAILVLGMHRSGTSALTRFIGQLGATLPNDPLGGAGGASDNPAGFWEPLRVIGQNDTILAAAGSTWFDTAPLSLHRIDPAAREALQHSLGDALYASFPGASCFVVKDPRMCRMVPFYREVLTGLGVRPCAVLMVRDPREVAASLYARNQISSGYTSLLWANHVIEAERSTRDLPRVVLAFDDLLAAPGEIAVPLCRLMGRPVPAAGNLAATLRPELRHHAGGDTAIPPALAEKLDAIFAACLALRTEDHAHNHARLDAEAAAFGQVAERLCHATEAEYAFHRLTMEGQSRRQRTQIAQHRAFAAAMERLQAALLNPLQRAE